MDKPVIYFQYDYDRFRKSQYPAGWFSYEDHGVGKIVDNRSSLVNEITRLVESGCVMEDLYKERVKNIYKFHDYNNCRRVYNSIIEMKM
jgi:CDP-glycerol glycerophosphotransferase (TagB/SpsB family)